MLTLGQPKKILTILLLFLFVDYSGPLLTKVKAADSKYLSKKEMKLFLIENEITFDDGQGNGAVTYIFEGNTYIRFKDDKEISRGGWRFTKLGALRVFQGDTKLTWKIYSDKSTIEIRAKGTLTGKKYSIEKYTNKVEAEKLRAEEKKRIEEEKKLAKQQKEEEKRIEEEKKLAKQQKEEEERKRIEEEKQQKENEEMEVLKAELEKLKEEKRLELEKVKQSKKQEAEKYNHSNNELISKVRKISELLLELENNEESEELLINYIEKVNSLLSTIDAATTKEEIESINVDTKIHLDLKEYVETHESNIPKYEKKLAAIKKEEEKKRLKEEKERKKAEKIAEEKRLKEEKERKKAEQATKELYNSVINAKWGMKGFPCDMNGGTYEKYVPGKGFMFWAGGKIQDGAGLSIIEADITQISETEFVVNQVFYPTRQNSLVYGAIGGNRRTGGSVRSYKIINEDLLQFNNKIEMLDMDALLAGKKGNAIGYTYQNENSTRVRCK